MPMIAPASEGIDLFKIAGRSISGWIPSYKTGTAESRRQPFCSQLEERLLMWLEYHPLVSRYARGDIGPKFATTYRLPTPSDAPFAIGYTFEGKPHDYLPDVVGTLERRSRNEKKEVDKRSQEWLAQEKHPRKAGRRCNPQLGSPR
jgi:hypothetical protein